MCHWIPVWDNFLYSDIKNTLTHHPLPPVTEQLTPLHPLASCWDSSHPGASLSPRAPHHPSPSPARPGLVLLICSQRLQENCMGSTRTENIFILMLRYDLLLRCVDVCTHSAKRRWENLLVDNVNGGSDTKRTHGHCGLPCSAPREIHRFCSTSALKCNVLILSDGAECAREALPLRAEVGRLS